MWGNGSLFMELVWEEVSMQPAHHSKNSINTCQRRGRSLNKTVYRYALCYYDTYNDVCLYLVMRKNLELKNQHKTRCKKTAWKLCLRHIFYAQSYMCRHIWTYTWIERGLEKCLLTKWWWWLSLDQGLSGDFYFPLYNFLKIIYIVQENELVSFIWKMKIYLVVHSIK